MVTTSLQSASQSPGLVSFAGIYRSDNALGDLIRYALALVRRNLALVAGIIGAVLALAVIATVLQAPRYSAQARIQINDQSEQVLGSEMEVPTLGNAGWDTERFLNTQLDILRSRGLALKVADELKLHADPKFFAAMQQELPDPSIPAAIRREQVVSMLTGGMSVELPEASRIATITFRSTDPVQSARLANAYADQFIKANLQRQFDSSAYARAFVSQRMEEARKRLEASERALNTYARQAGLIRTPEAGVQASGNPQSGSVVTASLMQLNEAANAAQARRAEAEARWAAEQSAPLLSSPTILANPTVQALMTRRSALAGELQDARARYLPDHPAVSRLESELSAVDRQLDRTAQQVRGAIRSEYAAAQAAEDRLRGRVAQLQQATMAEQDRAVRYNILAREAETNRSIYDGLLQRYRELNAAAGIATSNVAMIDRADPPLAPSSPSLLRNLLVALVLGPAFAGIFLFLRDQLDDRIRVPEDIEQKIQLPLLGVIPLDADKEPLATLTDPKSPLSEAYNSLRGSLLHSTPAGLPRVMLITSAQPSEGKTTTSYAIARSMALAGKRALLIDADLRRPSLHRIASLNNERGLSSLLRSQASLADTIQSSEHEKLSLLPSGPIPSSPTELLSSPVMAALLEEASEKFDVVLVDCAPVLGLADSPVLSAIVDGVVLVIEADRGRGGALKTAIRRLRGMNPVIVGAVLTKFDPEHAGNRYSEYYGYEYYRYSQAGS